MQPAARLQAAIEILDQIEEGIRTAGAPADVVLNSYCRARRYMGSKDRRAISELVYSVLRRRGQHVWRLQTAELAPTGRSLLVSHLALNDAGNLSLFGGQAEHAPSALSAMESDAVKRMPFDMNDAPMSAKMELPRCLEAGLKARFGADLEAAMQALNEPATLDIRSNPLKPISSLNDNLKEVYQDIEKSAYSPVGYHIKNKVNISGSDLFRQGHIEIQDEAAQLACYLVMASPGMSVVDLCAGAGGKSLLVSAQMQNRGQLYAFDVSGKRLTNAKPRFQRAGVRNIQTSVLPADAEERTRVLSGFAGKADRVIIDAPCSGTGTWRRNPDQRWRLTEQSVRQFSDTQAALLQEGARMVRTGGRLVYMTCSLLPCENEEVITQFLKVTGDAWKLLDFSTTWREVLPGSPPVSMSSNPACLQLVPHKHRTDGFFVAILEKAPLS